MITTLQNNFIHAIVYDGVSGAEACRRAGYSPASSRQTASQLLSSKHIQKAIRDEQFKYLNGTLASKALKTLERVIDDEGAPVTAKVQAAIAILHRAGLDHDTQARVISDTEKTINEMTREELERFIKASELMLANANTENQQTVVDV